jgi:hypothetical protein
MSTTLVHASVSIEDQEAIKKALNLVHERFPFLVDLSVEERRLLPKLGDKSRVAFVRKALDVAELNPGVLPASFDVAQMRNDAQLLEYLSSIELAIRQLHKRVEDTAMQVGSQTFRAARIVYQSAKSNFAGGALKTASGELGKHFKRRAKAVAPAPEDSSEAPPVTTAT